MDSSDDAVIWSVHTVVAYMLVPSWGLAAPALRIGPENMCNTDHLTMLNVTWSCMRTYLCSRVPRWAVGCKVWPSPLVPEPTGTAVASPVGPRCQRPTHPPGRSEQSKGGIPVSNLRISFVCLVFFVLCVSSGPSRVCPASRASRQGSGAKKGVRV